MKVSLSPKEPANDSHFYEEPEGKIRLRKKANTKSKMNFSNFQRKVLFILPFVWPVGNRRLQVRVIVAFGLLVAIRVVSVMVPIYSKKIVNELTTPINNNYPSCENQSIHNSEGDGPSIGVPFPWKDILMFICLRSLRGGAGILNCLRSLIFFRVAQHAQKSLRLQLFAHLHDLSVRWHLQRKTGEVIKVMDRGVNSINQILSHVQANIVPVIIDIVVAVIYFVFMFNIWVGLILLSTMVAYLGLTIAMSEWRKQFRRKMNSADNERNASGVDSILNFETVKYFSAEEWETDRYSVSVDEFQFREFLVNATANLLGTMQNFIMSVGLMGGCLMTAWYVHKGQFQVGDYVLFLTYVHQLYEPLDLFGAYYRILQQAIVDMENMFDMLAEEREVNDEPNAADLIIKNGEVEFEDVCFSYTPSKPVLSNVTFTVPPGQTYALVGHSGSGKTTITRLLLRFYDIQSGCIRIDGQDVSKATQKSVRQHIGVVPQDTGLFNSEVRYNIRYGRVTATDEEVEDAARAADIHERITNLVDGYESKIGERGLKLSGGERQRIAIARTVLKSPEIVLLDEATSALDTRTERTIQASLARICQNRTTIIVAHRLSTIIHAHQILVLHEGRIAERGTHEDLLRADGLYAQMWQQQQKRSSKEDESSEVGSGIIENVVNHPDMKGKQISKSFRVGAGEEVHSLRKAPLRICEGPDCVQNHDKDEAMTRGKRHSLTSREALTSALKEDAPNDLDDRNKIKISESHIVPPVQEGLKSQNKLSSDTQNSESMHSGLARYPDTNKSEFADATVNGDNRFIKDECNDDIPFMDDIARTDKVYIIDETSKLLETTNTNLQPDLPTVNHMARKL